MARSGDQNAPRSTHVTAATDPFATRLRSSSSVRRLPVADDPTRAPHNEQRYDGALSARLTVHRSE
jgi:hypothetical protein